VSTVPGRFAIPLAKPAQGSCGHSLAHQRGLPCVDCVHHRDRISHRGLDVGHAGYYNRTSRDESIPVFTEPEEVGNGCSGGVAAVRAGECGSAVVPAEYGAQRMKTLLTSLAPLLPR
jgi:hypothetical protein